MFRRASNVAVTIALTGTALTAIPAVSAAARSADAPAGLDELCIRAQTQTANLRVQPYLDAGGTFDNVTYTDATAFEKSKPQVKPLVTGEFGTYEDAEKTLPKQVRCKGKSADHLQDVYGAAIAGPEQPCSVVNKETVRLVGAELTPAEQTALRYQPKDVVVDGDFPAFTGWDWLFDFPAAYVGFDRRLHLPSRSLSAAWKTPLLPENFRGQHYCTLVAPSYLKRLLLGQTSA